MAGIGNVEDERGECTARGGAGQPFAVGWVANPGVDVLAGRRLTSRAEAKDMLHCPAQLTVKKLPKPDASVIGERSAHCLLSWFRALHGPRECVDSPALDCLEPVIPAIVPGA